MNRNLSRRNVVLIVCDQLRPDFLSAYGSDFIPTPNIDELARNGVTFDNAITASTVCAPARASMVTGQLVSGHDGWTNNIPCRAGTARRTHHARRASGDMLPPGGSNSFLTFVPTRVI